MESEVHYALENSAMQWCGKTQKFIDKVLPVSW